MCAKKIIVPDVLSLMDVKKIIMVADRMHKEHFAEDKMVVDTRLMAKVNGIDFLFFDPNERPVFKKVSGFSCE